MKQQGSNGGGSNGGGGGSWRRRRRQQQGGAAGEQRCILPAVAAAAIWSALQGPPGVGNVSPVSVKGGRRAAPRSAVHCALRGLRIYDRREQAHSIGRPR